MGRTNYFQFKKFKIIQQQAAMKVGTDGVLLGAWANVANATSILDVGTGTGLIALMMAQRSPAEITGIEIEKNAAEEALKNALNSPWNHRIKIIHAALQDYEKMKPEPFDLIISNPPFFENSQRSRCAMLAMAKHNHLLPLSDLIDYSNRLLSPRGKFAVILPAEAATSMIQLAEKNNLYLIRETEVKPYMLKKTHRYLLEFGKMKEHPVEKDIICIHQDESGDFTEKYIQLTKDFYLNF